MADEAKTFMVEGANLIFRNFTGREGQYNREGDRNFSITLDPQTAKVLEKDGWNVKYLEAREEGEEDTPYITIAVNFKQKPPRVVMIASKSRTTLTEDQVGVLDWADIKVADLIARGYDWVVGDKSGTKAYLKSLFVTIEEDELERKYGISDTPDQEEV